MRFVYLCDKFSGCKHYAGKNCNSRECKNTTDKAHALCDGCEIEGEEITRGYNCKGDICPYFLDADKDKDNAVRVKYEKKTCFECGRDLENYKPAKKEEAPDYLGFELEDKSVVYLCIECFEKDKRKRRYLTD